MCKNLISNKRYGHSYVASIASRGFILREFCKEISDYNLEIKYLRETKKRKCVFNNRAVVSENVFNIAHGIKKENEIGSLSET